MNLSTQRNPVLAKQANLDNAYLIAITDILNMGIDPEQSYKNIRSLMATWNENRLMMQDDPDYDPEPHLLVLMSQHKKELEQTDQLFKKCEKELDAVLKNGPMPPLNSN